MAELLNYIDIDFLYVYRRLLSKHPDGVRVFHGMPCCCKNDYLKEDLEFMCEVTPGLLVDMLNLIVPTTKPEEWLDCDTFYIKPKYLKQIKASLKDSEGWQTDEQTTFNNLVKAAYEKLDWLNEFRELQVMYLNGRSSSIPFKDRHFTEIITFVIHEGFEITWLFSILRHLLEFTDGLRAAARYARSIKRRMV